MNLLAKGQALFARLMPLEASPAGPVTYRRGAETVDLTGKAWVGRTVFSRVPHEGGASVVYGDRDYLILVADIVIDGVRFEPARGHRIEEVIDGVTRVFDVVDPFGEPAVRPGDPGRTFWRIHAKELK